MKSDSMPIAKSVSGPSVGATKHLSFLNRGIQTLWTVSQVLVALLIFYFSFVIVQRRWFIGLVPTQIPAVAVYAVLLANCLVLLLLVAPLLRRLLR